MYLRLYLKLTLNLFIFKTLPDSTSIEGMKTSGGEANHWHHDRSQKAVAEDADPVAVETLRLKGSWREDEVWHPVAGSEFLNEVKAR